jgi:hypothetical protein
LLGITYRQTNAAGGVCLTGQNPAVDVIGVLEVQGPRHPRLIDIGPMVLILAFDPKIEQRRPLALSPRGYGKYPLQFAPGIKPQEALADIHQKVCFIAFQG